MAGEMWDIASWLGTWWEQLIVALVQCPADNCGVPQARDVQAAVLAERRKQIKADAISRATRNSSKAAKGKGTRKQSGGGGGGGGGGGNADFGGW
jgi:uncharacterized membrane protein YgcG